MPNGHRDPYRFQFPDIGDPESETALSSWSDWHSSDSDETLENKIRFLAFDEVAHKVLFRWKFRVWQNRRRTCNAIRKTLYQALTPGIAKCIVSCMFRRLPPPGRSPWGLPIPGRLPTAFYVCSQDQYRNYGLHQEYQEGLWLGDIEVL